MNNINGLSVQCYADDFILQSDNLEILQTGYDKIIELYKELNLHINADKCELISNTNEDIIYDKSKNVEIIAMDNARYLGQIINYEGLPTSNINTINFGPLINIIRKEGSLTRIAKIRIFHVFMKTKINHLIPLIAITGGIKELWKSIREIIFRDLLEYSTLPRESAKAFNLGYYDVIIKPIVKLIRRIEEYNNEQEEIKYLNEALKELYKYWTIAEPNQTDIIKENIVKIIENNDYSGQNEIDKLINTESFNRLYKGHSLNEEESKKLNLIKSPGLIVLISNEPTHEIRERIINFQKRKKIKKMNLIESRE